MKESFPSLNIENILILDKDREPGSLVSTYLIIGGGIALILIAIGIILKVMRENTSTRAHNEEI